MFFRKKPAEPDAADARIQAVVSAALPDADADTVAVVSACAGLLASVAFADREFSATERAHVRTALEGVNGIGPAGAQAIADVLALHLLELSTVHTTRFTRTLKELGDRDLRLHVLEMLIDLGAADGQLRRQEVVVLRQTAAALGLEQDDYNRLQARHRDKLGNG